MQVKSIEYYLRIFRGMLRATYGKSAIYCQNWNIVGITSYKGTINLFYNFKFLHKNPHNKAAWHRICDVRGNSGNKSCLQLPDRELLPGNELLTIK
jgi:hypothetical protein